LERWQRVLAQQSEQEGVFTCHICKEPYTHQISTSSVVRFLRSHPALSLVCAVLGFVLCLPLLLNLVVLLMIFVTGCYAFGVRPDLVRVRIKQTSDGVRLAFIHTGPSVKGLQQGILLAATDLVKNGIFEGSRVLLLRYSASGAVGVILNHEEYNNVLDQVVHIGVRTTQGPISSQAPIVLHTKAAAAGAQPITEDIYLGGELGEAEIALRLWGFACWKAGQLDGEVRAGMWRSLGTASSQVLL
jgi:putative AlgH/UPF0301 family transcriptional regulator